MNLFVVCTKIVIVIALMNLASGLSHKSHLSVHTSSGQSINSRFIFQSSQARVERDGNMMLAECHHVSDRGNNDYCNDQCALGAPGGDCDGPPRYCNRNDTNCGESHACRCTLVNVQEDMLVMVGEGNFVKVESIEVTTPVRKRKMSALGTKRAKVKRNSVESFQAHVSFDDPKLSFVITNMLPVQVFLFKGVLNKTFVIEERFLNIYLDPEFLLTTNKLVVRMTGSNGQISEYNFDVMGRSICKIYDCILCTSSVMLWKCLPDLYKTLLILLAVGIIIAILCALASIWSFIALAFRCTFVPLYYCLCCMASVHRSRLAKKFGQASKSVVNNFSYYMQPNEPKLVNNNYVSNRKKVDIERRAATEAERSYQEEIAEMRRRRARDEAVKKRMMEDEAILSDDDFSYQSNANRMSRRARNSGRYKSSRMNCVTLFIALLCFGSLVNCCDNGLIVTGNLIDCVDSGTSEDCRFITTASISLRNIGYKVCLDLRDQNSGEHLVNMEITYHNHVRRANLVNAYHTSDWEALSYSEHRCRESGQCRSSICETTNPSVDPSYGGEIEDPEVLTWPGLSTCRRSCGCATCGCFLCSPSCIFSRYALKPVGEAHQVFIISQQTDEPMILVSMNSSSTSDEFSVKFSDGVVDKGFMSFEVLGSLSNPATDFAERKLMVSGEISRLVFASEINNPSFGKIGDIQSPNEDQLFSEDRDAFIYDFSIISVNEGDRSTTYNFVQSGINTLEGSVELPAQISGNVWSFRDGVLSTTATSVSTLLLSVQFSNMTIRRVRNIVCPVCSLIEVSGCYNCPDGAEVRLSSKSSCKEGSVVLESSSNQITLTTTSLSLGLQDAEYQVRFFTSLENNDFNLVLRSEHEECSLNVQFTALAFEPVRNDTTIITDDPTTGSGGGDDWWRNLWRGVGLWWHYAIMVAIVVAVVMIIAAVMIGAVMKVLGTSGKEYKEM